MKTIDNHKIVATFSGLAHVRRIEIFEQLLSHAPHGMAFGEISSATDIATSTLNHHLREMEDGGIIRRQPKGRSTVFFLELDYLQQVLAQLMSRCCQPQR